MRTGLRKLIQTTISLFTLFACNSSVHKEQEAYPSKPVKITLVDSLGTITLSIPTRYDTFFSWVNRSDCGKPCEQQEYRYQPRTLPITMESGFFWTGEPRDSVDRFTISHSGYLKHNPEKNILDSNVYGSVKSRLAVDPSHPRLISDTIEKIGDRYFSIFVMQNADTIHDLQVLAVTRIKGNEVEFRCDLLSKKQDSIAQSFVANSFTLIRSIKVNLQ